jgi:hypothetical protein
MARGEFAKALKDVDEIGITVIGRSSGRKISLSVWFVQEGKTLYLLPVKGSDSEWYKNVLKTRTIELAAKGASRKTKVTPITEAARVRGIADKFRAKYGAGEVKKYYSKFDVAVKIPLTPAKLTATPTVRKESR